MTNRTQFVGISQTDRSNCIRHRLQSSPWVIAHGVPQVSILGPLLFLVYTNDLPLNIQEAKLVLYADDLDVLVINKNEEALQAWFSSFMKLLEVCFLKNNLIINTTKTDAMSFHLCHSKLPYKLRILLRSTEISCMSEVKF